MVCDIVFWEKMSFRRNWSRSRRGKGVQGNTRGQRYLNMPRLEGLFARGMKRDKGWRNQKITEAVRDWGYSQKEIADCLGMHYSTVSRIWKRTSSVMESPITTRNGGLNLSGWTGSCESLARRARRTTTTWSDPHRGDVESAEGRIYLVIDQ